MSLPSLEPTLSPAVPISGILVFRFKTVGIKISLLDVLRHNQIAFVFVTGENGFVQLQLRACRVTNSATIGLFFLECSTQD